MLAWSLPVLTFPAFAAFLGPAPQLPRESVAKGESGAWAGIFIDDVYPKRMMKKETYIVRNNSEKKCTCQNTHVKRFILNKYHRTIFGDMLCVEP